MSCKRFSLFEERVFMAIREDVDATWQEYEFITSTSVAKLIISFSIPQELKSRFITTSLFVDSSLAVEIKSFFLFSSNEKTS